MGHILKRNQSKVACYLVGAAIGALNGGTIALIMSLAFSPRETLSDSSFLDVQAGSVLTVFVYSILIGDLHRIFKENKFSDALFWLGWLWIAVAGGALVANWILSIPLLFLISPFLDRIFALGVPHLPFIWGGANMLGIWFIIKNEPSKYDEK
jgi:hypothetical protein